MLQQQRLFVRRASAIILGCLSILLSSLGLMRTLAAPSEAVVKGFTPDYAILDGDFTIVALPDTQKYTTSTDRAAIFNAQTQWISDNRNALRIAYVAHLGDIVDTSGVSTGSPPAATATAMASQWNHAAYAMSKLEMNHVPYGVAPGNHDYDIENGNVHAGTSHYNQYFGSGRFQSNYPSNYGGYYGSNNDNNYMLFSAGGMDYIVLNLAYDGRYQSTEPSPYTRYTGMGAAPSPDPVLQWADGVLKTYPNHRAIVVTHYLLRTDGNMGNQANAIYNELKDNNIFLMLSGHMGGSASTPGESRKTLAGGIPVLLSDYQSMTNGGNGYLRIMTISPSRNRMFVRTYSPTLDQQRTQASSKFDLDITTPVSVDGSKTYGQVESSAGKWYAFNLSAPGEVDVMLWETSATYVSWALYRNGTQVAWGDDGELLQYNAPEAGTYYINVTGYTGVSYTLSLYPGQGWTAWLDRDNPSGDGDWETRADFPGVCAAPLQIDGRTLTGTYWYDTGEKLSVSPGTGLVCRNAEQNDKYCLDYKVRFFCP
ncbi:MAG: metallophosphoesterase [Chloroflexota bacterium]